MHIPPFLPFLCITRIVNQNRQRLRPDPKNRGHVVPSKLSVLGDRLREILKKKTFFKPKDTVQVQMSYRVHRLIH